MSTILNFSKSNIDSVLVVQPDYRIGNYQPEMRYQSGDKSFRIVTGCKTTLITPKNINEFLRESTLAPAAMVNETFIQKKTVKTAPKANSAIVGETSKSYFISKAGKLYPKSDYKTVEASVALPKKHFEPARYGNIDIKFSDGSRSVSKSDFANVIYILNLIKTYYTDNKIDMVD